MAGADDFDARVLEMRPRNFNPYLDAADFARALLGFWELHPELRAAPVVVVAESYGGVRAGIFLDLFLEHDAYDGGDRPYRDPALVLAIAEHLALRFPDADAFPPALVAEQFGHQVLIQPSVAGGAQKAAAGASFEGPSSPMEALAQALGVDFVPCAEKGPECVPYDNGLAFVKARGRSIYDVQAPASWLDDLFAHSAEGLSDPMILEALVGVAPAAIDGLSPRQRTLGELRPYRLADPNDAPSDGELGELGGLLGPLSAWDRYYMVFSREANITFRSGVLVGLDVDPDDPHHGRTFLRNLLHVDTLITRAADDVAIYAPSLPATFAGYTSIVSDASLVGDAPAGAARPGEIVVRYVDAAFPGVVHGETRRIRAPGYAGASHAVTLDAPAEIFADVRDWLAASGLDADEREDRRREDVRVAAGDR